MKFRMTITVDLEDPRIYDLDSIGWPVADSGERVDKQDVMVFVAEAVSAWGGQFAPGDAFFPRNIRSVAVRADGFDPVVTARSEPR